MCLYFLRAVDLPLTRYIVRCGTASRWRRAVPQVICWGLVGMENLNRSKQQGARGSSSVPERVMSIAGLKMFSGVG